MVRVKSRPLRFQMSKVSTANLAEVNNFKPSNWNKYSLSFLIHESGYLKVLSFFVFPDRPETQAGYFSFSDRNLKLCCKKRIITYKNCSDYSVVFIVFESTSEPDPKQRCRKLSVSKTRLFKSTPQSRSLQCWSPTHRWPMSSGHI